MAWQNFVHWLENTTMYLNHHDNELIAFLEKYMGAQQGALFIVKEEDNET